METALFIAGYIFLIFSLVPLVRNDNWVFRIFEYPRFQKLLINVLILVLFLSVTDWAQTHDVVFAGLIFLNIGYLTYQIFPYTAVAGNQMKRKKTPVNSENAISLLICNVFQDNKKVDVLLRQINQYNPDIVLLVEVDAYWDARLRAIHPSYPFRKLNPLQNTYGMSLYSKLELIDPHVKYLIQQDIPSIHTSVKLRSGKVVKLFGLHPEPPVPGENPRSTERDAEILLVAKNVEHEKSAVIVAGDLNDVAWSYSTELFLKVSGLLDPRRGRGFFNTFHAKYPLLRWPLDHVFCSKHFCLLDLKRLDNMGSDHFPMFISIELSAEKEQEQQEEKLDKTPKDEALAEEKIQKVS